MIPEKDKKTTYTDLKPVSAPIVKLSAKADKWLKALAEVHETEIGCYGVVEELGNDTYLISEIFYPKNDEANGGTCQISSQGEAAMGDWFIDHGRECDVGKISRFWGHSHINMGVSPSMQDEESAIKRMNMNQAYLIRGIFNKQNIMSISFFDFINQRRFDNIAWTVDEVDIEYDAIKAKVTELKKTNMPETKASAYSDTATMSLQQSVINHYYKTHSSLDGDFKNAMDNDDFWNKSFKPNPDESFVHEFARCG
jgi:hypothetical protein